MRLLNILVICALVVAASAVYKIKFDSTLQAEKVAKMRSQLRRERNAIAVLRAEWARLQTPGRVQALAGRHLALQPVKPTQFGDLNDLPPRPVVPPTAGDPIAALMASPAPQTTGSVPAVPSGR
jgi:hypothetical protein